MSDSTEASNKAGEAIMQIIRPAVPAMEKLTPATRARQALTVDPSPVSTYGDTATDGSDPDTPLDVRGKDVTSGILEMLIENDIKSPTSMLVQGSTCLMLNEHVSSPSEIAHESSSVNSSPKTGRLDANAMAPTWCGPANDSFVGSTDANVDPFVNGSTPSQSASNASTVTLYRVREDREGNLPTPGTAQAHFDPEACVFVANLLQVATDPELESAVTSSFGQFGKVYVKIRRDCRQMPYAFAQYEAVHEAQRAVIEGRNLPIFGRPCRTEIAKVHRTLYLTKTTGGDVTVQEARRMLQGYGAIEDFSTASPAERALYRLAPGVFVRFHFYDDAHDAQINFRINDHYRLEHPGILGDLRPSPRFRQRPANMLVRLEDRSIFVGVLPWTFNDRNVRDRFARFGFIRNVEYRTEQLSMDLGPVSAFSCFVEYSTMAEAAAAIHHASPWFDGLPLCIVGRGSRRLLTAQTGSPNGNPNGNHQMGNSQLSWEDMQMMMFYQRGINVGIIQAHQAQTMAAQAQTIAAQAQTMIAQPMSSTVFPTYSQPYFPHHDTSVVGYGGPNGTSSTYGPDLTSYGSSGDAAVHQHHHPQPPAPTTYGQIEQGTESNDSATADNDNAGPAPSSTIH